MATEIGPTIATASFSLASSPSGKSTIPTLLAPTNFLLNLEKNLPRFESFHNFTKWSEITFFKSYPNFEQWIPDNAILQLNDHVQNNSTIYLV